MKLSMGKQKIYMREWYKRNREKQKKEYRKWYLENKEEHINKIRKRQVETNYKTEKRPLARIIRQVKRKTRYKYPIKNEFCFYCGEKATEHHHLTRPIDYKKFKFVCHNCHIKQDLKMDNHNRLVRGQLI